MNYVNKPEKKEYRESHKGKQKAVDYDDAWEEGSANSLFWKLEQMIIKEEIGALPSCPESVLDFACGTGRIISLLEEYVDECVGIDISETMLERARDRCGKSRFIEGDLTKSPGLIEKKFDLVTSFRFFLNAEEELRREVLRSIKSVLKENGVLIANFHFNPVSFTGVVQRTLNKFRDNEPNMISLRQTEELLRANGFKILNVRGYGYLFHRKRKTPFKRFMSFLELRLAKWNPWPMLGFYFIVVAAPVKK
ncbi:MAG: class I SAM-dependent DNA methyltransferase [bacterium]